MDGFTSRGDLDAIQAFQWISRRTEPNTSVISQLGAISSASLRARMLGDDDASIAKLAYQDSLAARPVKAHPVVSRLLVHWLRPKVKRTPDRSAVR